MSNFIDKLSNKISGNNAESESDFSQQQQQRGSNQKTSGQTRSGQQSGIKRSDQQFSTGNTDFDDDYSNANKHQSSQFGSTQGRSQQGEWEESSGLRGNTRQQQHSGNIPGTRSQVEDWDSQDLSGGTGRQTRSQASSGLGGSSLGGHQSQSGQMGKSGNDYAQQAEELGRKGFEKGYEEGQKYVNRNL